MIHTVAKHRKLPRVGFYCLGAAVRRGSVFLGRQAFPVPPSDSQPNTTAVHEHLLSVFQYLKYLSSSNLVIVDSFESFRIQRSKAI